MNKRILSVMLLGFFGGAYQGYGSIVDPFKDLGHDIQSGLSTALHATKNLGQDIAKKTQKITNQVTSDVNRGLQKATRDIQKAGEDAGHAIQKGLVKAPKVLAKGAVTAIDRTDQGFTMARNILVNKMRLPPQLVDVSLLGMYKNMVDTVHDAVHAGSLKDFLKKRGEAVQHGIREMTFADVPARGTHQGGDSAEEASEEMAGEMAMTLLKPSATVIHGLYCASNQNLRDVIQRPVDTELKRNGGRDVKEAFEHLLNESLSEDTSRVERTIDGFFTGATEGNIENLAVMVYIISEAQKHLNNHESLCSFTAEHAQK